MLFSRNHVSTNLFFFFFKEAGRVFPAVLPAESKQLPHLLVEFLIKTQRMPVSQVI